MRKNATANDASGGIAVALAVGAHPDDIEFMMAGTLLLLKEAGAQIHMWNVANGCCGSGSHGRDELIAIRGREADAAAKLAGAVLHPPVADDLAIDYRPAMLARAAHVIRAVKPGIILVPSPDEYMEDHSNTSRLMVTAAFARALPNYETEPPYEAWNGATTLYHAMPYGLRDGLGKMVRPGWYVDIDSVIDLKREMLAQHRTQGEWLEESQGAGALVGLMEEMCLKVGEMSGRFRYAEGWRRHSHLGFCAEGFDPLGDLLGPSCRVDPEYLMGLG